MPLSDAQVRRLQRTIQDKHKAFLVEIGLGDQLDEEEVARLVRLGYVDPSVATKSFADDAFLFGYFLDALKESGQRAMTYASFQKFMKERGGLTPEETAAVRAVKKGFANHIMGLGNRMAEGASGVVIEADKQMRRRLDAAVNSETVRGIEKRKSLAEIATGLRQVTKDAARDWLRIASTEVNNGFQEGKLALIQKSNKGKDPLVFKRVREDACDECKDAYLLDSGKPRVFRLSELLAHGSNVGKSRAERRATVGSFHPWCTCELQQVPEGFDFDDSGDMRYVGLR